MFTGLIEATGRLVERKTTGGGLRFRIASPLAAELAAGDSLAVNGVCLTVILADGADMLADRAAQSISSVPCAPTAGSAGISSRAMSTRSDTSKTARPRRSSSG
jgi:riboflavin synthase alpha subunit